MPAKRTTSLAAALAAAALSLAACGGSTDTVTSAATTAAATGSTSAGAASTDSASVSQSASASATATATDTAASSSSSDAGGGAAVDLADAQVGDQVDATALGAAMAEVFKDGQSGHMTMDMSPIKAEGDFEVKDGKQNSTMTMEMGGQKIDMISVAGVTYMKGLTGGTKWVKTDASAMGGAPNAGAFDPATMSKAFGGQQAKVTAKDGDTTTYSLELDLKKLFEAMDTELPTTMTLPETIPVTYVLDGENRPVKSTIDMGTNIVVEYSDWGKKVDIKAPPASEVTTG